MARSVERRPTLSDLKARGDRAIIASALIKKDLHENLALCVRTRENGEPEEANGSSEQQTSQPANPKRNQR